MTPRLAFVLLVLASACRGGPAKERREGSAAPVQVVDQPALPDAGGKRAAATSDEIEPNDTADVATPLTIGSMVRGKIDPETDVDRYQLDVTQAGELAVMVSGIDGVDLALELEDASGNVLARSDRGGARTREGVPNFGVVPGRYVAVVRAIAKKKGTPKPKPKAKGGKAGKAEAAAAESPKSPAPVYELSAAMVAPPAGAEREPDDDRGTANDLIVGDTATGLLGWSGDADVWKLSVETLSAKNAIDIEIGAVEGVALELEIADGIGTQLADRKAPRGAPLVVRGLVPMVPPGGSPFYYLTVRGDRSNPETAYQLRATAKLLAPDAEQEPDDSPDHAYALPADRTVVHATWTPGDVDCIAVPVAPNARVVEVTIDAPPELALSAEWLLDGRSAGSKRGSVAGDVPAGSHGTVCVRGTDPAATAEGAYDLTFHEAAE